MDEKWRFCCRELIGIMTECECGRKLIHSKPGLGSSSAHKTACFFHVHDSGAQIPDYDL